jgi:hypothetical protein
LKKYLVRARTYKYAAASKLIALKCGILELKIASPGSLWRTMNQNWKFDSLTVWSEYRIIVAYSLDFLGIKYVKKIEKGQ